MRTNRMGTVFLGTSPDGHPATVKPVDEELARDPRFRRRFVRAIHASRRIRGPHTPALLDADPYASIPWMATEYLPGPSLAQAVTECGALPSSALPPLTLGLAEALRTAHDVGLAHLDLSPDHVLLTPHGPQVIDFGIADAVEGAGPLSRILGPGLAGSRAGTRAPLPDDVFRLAEVVVFAATGADIPAPDLAPPPPLRAARVRSRLGEVLPVPLREMLASCLSEDPADRPSAGSLLLRLRVSAVPGDGRLPEAFTEQIDRTVVDLRSTLTGDPPYRAPHLNPLVRLAPEEEPPPTSAPPPVDPVDLREEGSPAPAHSGAPVRPISREPRRRFPTAPISMCAMALVAVLCLVLFVLRPGAEGGGGAAAGFAPLALDDPLVGLAFTPQGGLWVHTRTSLELWKRGAGSPLSVHEPAPREFAVRSDGALVGLSSFDRVELWPASGGAPEVLVEEEPDRGMLRSLALSPDGTMAATLSNTDPAGAGEHLLLLWDLTGGGLLAETVVDGIPEAPSFNHDGTRLVALVSDASGGSVLSVWNTPDLSPHGVIEADSGDDARRSRVTAFATAPDRDFAAVEYGEDADLALYDLAALTSTMTLERPSDTPPGSRARSLLFTPDGATLIGGQAPVEGPHGLTGGSAWDSATGELLTVGATTLFPILAVGPKGRVIASGHPKVDEVVFLETVALGRVGDP
ncbi:kinase [Nocardiopsis alba]|uniref:protein kinase domain-containing protein n=1 Tax=Nocardiopsis alba TaxID=53437 RepID=UPI003827B86C